MSRNKANRLFSFLALFSIVFNNILTPLSVYAEDVQENPQQQEDVLVEPAPSTEETQDQVEITPTETIIPTPTVEESIITTPEATPEVSGETNEAAQPQAPPVTDTPTPTPSVEIVAPQGDEKLQVNIVEDVQAVSIDFMDIQYNPDGTASIKTDKLDYAPTDVVVITGTGFDVLTEYDLLITGTNDFNYTTKVTASDKGEILYSYQLDGTYRPEYKVEIKSGDVVIAEATFTDADTSLNTPDDVDGNISISGGDHNWSNSSDARTSNNDRAYVLITSSSNISNYLRATDFDFSIPNDALINGITVVIERSEGGQNPSKIRDYSVRLVKNDNVVGDNKAKTGIDWPLSDGTENYGGVGDLWGESWTANEINSNKFGVALSVGRNSGGDEYARVDAISISVNYSLSSEQKEYWCHCAASGVCNTLHLPMSALISAGHVDANGNPLHAGDYAGQCIQKGTIVVKKVTNPNTDTTTMFSFSGNAGGMMGNGEQINWGQQNPGSYTMTEDDPSALGYELESISCNDGASQTPSTWDLNSRTVYLNLDSGENLECTFTNKKLPVTFSINKYIDQDGDLENTTGDRSDGVGWTFQIYKEGAAPQLMATGTTDSTGNISMPPFYPESGKTYRVVEQSQSGYSFVSAKCGIAATPRGQIGTDSVDSISVNPGENIVCDFYNKPATGVLKITKDSRPNDTQDFLFTIRDSQGNIVGNAELDDWSGSSRPDNKSFTLNAGTYYITETVEGGSPDWKLTDAVCTTDTGSLGNYGFTPDGRFSAEVLPGQNMNCTFINTKYGGVYGEKFNDKNGNNIDDSGEEDLRGWRIYVDLNENGKYDSGEPTDVTDSGGDYSIGGLLPGEYSICEVQQSGWYSSLPNNALCQKTTIHSDGGDWDEVSFGNHGIVTIKAYKIVCPMEAFLPNWGYGPYGSIDGGTADWFLSHHTGCYYQDNWEFQWGYGGRGGVSSVPGDYIGYAPKTGDDYDEWKNFNTATNNHYGSQYSAKAYISDLKGSSSLWVREVLPSDEWLPFSDDTTWPRDNDVSAEMYCSGDILNYDNYDEINNPLYGESYYCIAFNTLNKGKITGVKWEDVDGDMHYERGENTIAGWNITATDSQGHSYSASTNASGEYEFDNLMPGEYTICEENQRGYIQTYPSEQSCHTVTVIGGRTESGNNFGNMPVDLNLAIEKTNILNTSNATVDYTIKVTNTGNMNFNSYEIHDALPGGFTYLAGSSYLNDNPIDDPVFNSGEAMWSIEEGLEIGETAILTYRATFDSGLPAGFYTNFAYAVGVFYYPWDNPEPSVFERAMIVDDSDDYTHEEPIIIRVSDTATTEIVDSQVELLSSVSYGGKLTGQVLGASTDVLPATGSETWVIMLATAFVVVGFVTKGAAIMIERKRKNE